MPKSIVKRANEILKQLESDNRQQGIAGKPLAEVSENRGGMQLSFFQLDDPILCQIRDEILNLDVNNLTPIEALNKLNDIKKIVRGKYNVLGYVFDCCPDIREMAFVLLIKKRD